MDRGNGARGLGRIVAASMGSDSIIEGLLAGDQTARMVWAFL